MVKSDWEWTFMKRVSRTRKRWSESAGEILRWMWSKKRRLCMTGVHWVVLWRSAWGTLPEEKTRPWRDASTHTAYPRHDVHRTLNFAWRGIIGIIRLLFFFFSFHFPGPDTRQPQNWKYGGRKKITITFLLSKINSWI